MTHSVLHRQQNRVFMSDQVLSYGGVQYIRHVVLGNEECGYTAFGITREHALQLLLAQHNQKEVAELLHPVAAEQLLFDGEFRDRVLNEKLQSVDDIRRLRENPQKTRFPPFVLLEYVRFDVRDKRVDDGWCHPAVLQALAEIRGIHLLIWQLTDDNRMIRHNVERYCEYVPAVHSQRKHLILINKNHFELLEEINLETKISSEIWNHICGILFDVSGSMKDRLGFSISSGELVTRAQTGLQTVVKLAEPHSHRFCDDHIFVTAFGGRHVDKCDFIALLEFVYNDAKKAEAFEKQLQVDSLKPRKPMTRRELETLLEKCKVPREVWDKCISSSRCGQHSWINGHEPLTCLLQCHGATNTEYYVKFLSTDKAGRLFEQYAKNDGMASRIVDNLPATCTERSVVVAPVLALGRMMVAESTSANMLIGLGTYCYDRISEAATREYAAACEEIGATEESGNRVKSRLMQLLLRHNIPRSEWHELLSDNPPPTHINSRRPLITLLQNHGAPNAEKWIVNYITPEVTGELFEQYAERVDIISGFVSMLPAGCREKRTSESSPNETPAEAEAMMAAVKTAFDFAAESVKPNVAIINEMRLRSEPTPMPLQRAFHLLQDVVETLSQSSATQSDLPRVGNKKIVMSARKLSKVLYGIAPYIYGRTPLYAALISAVETFSKSSHQSKSLLIVSDGEPTDTGDLNAITRRLRDLKVNVVTCLLSADHIAEPRRLYDKAPTNWTDAHKLMFNLSSEIDTNAKALAILVRQGWVLPTSGRCRLFVQANHPDVIDEFTSLLQTLTQSNDALFDMIGYISLNDYIQRTVLDISAPRQVGGTCWANAVAVVFHIANARVIGRRVYEFKTIRADLIRHFFQRAKSECTICNNKDYDCKRCLEAGPTDLSAVLEYECPNYGLHYREVDETGARMALNAKRVVIATFSLPGEKWKLFSSFYVKNPQGILKRSDLEPIPAPSRLAHRDSGHAVVLTRCDPNSLRFMNSWGFHFADQGFFKIADCNVLDEMKFYDVFWYESELNENEKKAFADHKVAIGIDYGQRLASDGDRAGIVYHCPLCGMETLASKFAGHMLEAKCPKCHKPFPPNINGLL